MSVWASYYIYTEQRQPSYIIVLSATLRITYVRTASITPVFELFRSMKNIGDWLFSRGEGGVGGVKGSRVSCKERQPSWTAPSSRHVSPRCEGFTGSLLILASFLHFVLRFWNHVLTWVSVSLRLWERSARFSSVRYFLELNSSSSVRTWCWLKSGRCFFFRSGRLLLLQLGL